MGDDVSRWAVPLLGAAAGVVMADPNVAGTALVEATRGLQMPTGWIPVAASIETYVTAATVVSSGLIADRLGRRRVLLGALLLLIVAELLTALSPIPAVYLSGRALTGLAVGAAFGSAFAFVRRVVPDERLGAGLGVFGAVATVVMMLTSVVGGSLAAAGWRLAFVGVAALAAMVAVLVPRLLPTVPRVGTGPVDLLGQFLLGLGVVLPLYGLSRAGTPGSQAWLAILAGLLCLGAFGLVERRRPDAFFPITLFADRRYLGAVVMGLSFNAAMAVLLLQLANIWQYLERWATWQVSLATMPAFVAGMAASLYAGRRLSAGMTPRRVAAIGFTLMVAGFATLTLFRHGGTVAPFFAALVLVGMGTQAVNVPYGSLMVQVAPKEKFGPVTSSRTTVGQIGYAIGLAGATVLIERLTLTGTLERLRMEGVSPLHSEEALSVVTAYVENGSEAVDDAGRQVLLAAANSYGAAFTVTMGAVAVILALAGMVTWWLLRPVVRSAPPVDVAPASG